MVRMTSKVCLYIFLAATQISLLPAESTTHLSDSSIAKEFVDEFRKWQEDRFDLTTDCRFAERIVEKVEPSKIRATRLARLDSLICEIATCNESLVSENSSSCQCESELAKWSAGQELPMMCDPHLANSVDSLAHWKTARGFLVKQEHRLAQAIRHLGKSTADVGLWATQATIESSVVAVENGDWAMEIRAFPNMLIPAALTSFGKQRNVKANSHELIQLPGPTRDSYWQYYDDCERWGVEFSNLLVEAVQSSEAVQSNAIISRVDLDSTNQQIMLAPSVTLLSVACVTLAQQLGSDWREFAQSVATVAFGSLKGKLDVIVTK